MNTDEQDYGTLHQPSDPPGREIAQAAQKLLVVLQATKPAERNELARRYAIAITEAEKLYAWIETWL